mmetsp:Transcript_20936/g.55057  ORF Transcript_20936/g.55057 Transcript_20936/m.55057 type:complete len:126 (+) Transcript_20936:70-447(+)
MADGGAPLSPAFWTQLGEEGKAAETQALLLNVAAQREVILALPAAERNGKRARADVFEVDAIVDVRWGKGCLVRWAQKHYHPTWERWRRVNSGEAEGSPLTTWEPRARLKNTEAWATWLAAQGSI